MGSKLTCSFLQREAVCNTGMLEMMVRNRPAPASLMKYHDTVDPWKIVPCDTFLGKGAASTHTWRLKDGKSTACFRHRRSPSF